MSVPVDLGRVETAITSREANSSWTFPLPARTAIHQLFVSLAIDEGGFEVPMTDDVRSKALETAYDNLDGFLQHIITKSMEVAKRSGYSGNKVGFPVVIRELDGWARQIKCHCWPR